MKADIYGRTDVGRKRTNNEDSFRIDEEINFFVVADGMGGHSSGEVASKMAVDVICDSMRQFVVNGQKAIVGKINPQFSERANQLASSVRLSNQFIYESAKTKPQHQGMGTTVDGVLIQKNKIHIGHVGDSRVYLVREGSLHQLTQDHSVVADQVRQGLIKKEEAEQSQLKNILTRALGVDENTEVDLVETDCYEGDFVIACTDGLNKMVTDEEILKTVLEMKTPKMIAEHLVDLANAAGGVDNTTVVVACLKK